MTAPPDVVIEDARRYANESPCQKSKRGAVVFSGTCTIAGGFNGPPMFGADIFQCDGSANCRRDCGKICEHAEARAIREATAITGRMGLTGFDLVHVKTVEGKVVAGGPPSCWQCSRTILDVGVGVWLFESSLGAWKRYTAAGFHATTLVNLGLHPYVEHGIKVVMVDGVASGWARCSATGSSTS